MRLLQSSATGQRGKPGSGCKSPFKNVLLFETKLFPLQLTCTDPATSTCPLGYFPTTLSSLPSSLSSTLAGSTLLCQQCDSLCASCDGPSASDCQTCSFAFFTSSMECLQSCDPSSGSDCVTCHSLCSGCTGRSDRDCITCREDSVVSREGETVCVSRCTEDTYLSTSNEVYTCQQCNSECIGCKGDTNSQCLTCRNMNLTDADSTQCLVSCPSGYYDSEGSCLPCHEYCMECTGPSNKNCTSCVDEEVEGECVPACITGQEYDTAEQKCTLKRSD